MQFVKYERFEPYMVKVQQERLFEPDSEETLLQAFKMFDPDQSASFRALRVRTCSSWRLRAEKYIDENSMIEILTDNPYAFRVGHMCRSALVTVRLLMISLRAVQDKELEAFLDFAKDQQSGNIFYEVRIFCCVAGPRPMVG